MPEDLKLSQICSSQLPRPFRGLHYPGVENTVKLSLPVISGLLTDYILVWKTLKQLGAGIAQWLEHRTRD